jgi:hypothetical protein
VERQVAKKEMSQRADPFLDDFVNKVHSGEYVIHEDAQKLQLPGGSLAYLLGQNMAQYEEAKKKSGKENDLAYNSVFVMTLLQLVNLAFSHNFVRSGEALHKKVRTLEAQVSTLTSEKWELREQIKRMFSECPNCHYKLEINPPPSVVSEVKGKRKRAK